MASTASTKEPSVLKWSSHSIASETLRPTPWLAWLPRSTMTRGRSSGHSARRCRMRSSCDVTCHRKNTSPGVQLAAFTPDTPAHARLGAGGPWSHVLGTGGAGAGEGDGEGGDGLEVTARVLTAIEAEAATAAPTAAACSEAAIACVVAMGAPIVKNTMSNEQAMKARATRWRGCIGFCRAIDITPFHNTPAPRTPGSPGGGPLTANGSHRRTSQPSKPTNTQPARQVVPTVTGTCL